MAVVWRSGFIDAYPARVNQFRCLQQLKVQQSKCLLSTTKISNRSIVSSFRNLFRRSPSKPLQNKESVVGTISQSTTIVPIKNVPQSKELVEMNATSVSESVTKERKKQKFIPLNRYELVKGLSKEHYLFSPMEITQMEKLSLSLDAYISRRYYIHLEELKFLYDAMDPDKDTIQTRNMSTKELLNDEYNFLQKIELLLDKANYYKLEKSDIARLLQSHDVSGVRVSVNPENYSTLRVWTRGSSSVNNGRFSRLKHKVKGALSRSKQLPLSNVAYTRVFVAVRSKTSHKLHLKIFKDVPCNELEYLVPDGKIEMSSFDKGFLMSSAFLGAVAITAKLFTVAANLQLDFGLVCLAIAGLIGARGWAGYKNKRNKYLVNLSRTLYFKTVANNRGVLTLMTDRAEDEEFKEALLGYMFLLSPPNRRGVPGTAYTPQPPGYHSKESLKQAIEKWLQESFGLTDIAFDVDDAIDKLDLMGLLTRHADNTFAVVPLTVALDILPNDPQYSLPPLSAYRMDLENSDAVPTPDDSKHYSGWQ